MTKKTVRILFTKSEQDAHDRGIRYVISKLRDAGNEVIYTNFLYPEEIANTAIQEDVDIIGLSSSTLGHMPVLRQLKPLLSEQGREDILIIVGGIIPDDDHEELSKMGITGIFGPGTGTDDIKKFISDNLQP
ncbi:MAG: cobalamin B12-binding domain-containing protein [Desulfatitalea sp.]|nr:cobalamin B12-binding domain-containing protein [Desulfatitalea sp.]NNK01759.1 cobalamin B12-binding domain-containing protein [Desulfatitalea sp.]